MSDRWCSEIPASPATTAKGPVLRRAGLPHPAAHRSGVPKIHKRQPTSTAARSARHLRSCEGSPWRFKVVIEHRCGPESTAWGTDQGHPTWATETDRIQASDAPSASAGFLPRRSSGQGSAGIRGEACASAGCYCLTANVS